MLRRDLDRLFEVGAVENVEPGYLRLGPYRQAVTSLYLAVAYAERCGLVRAESVVLGGAAAY